MEFLFVLTFEAERLFFLSKRCFPKSKSLQTTGLESVGDTWTKSKDSFFANSVASFIDIRPTFSPWEFMRITSSAFILSFIGVVFFLEEAISKPAN